MTRSGLLGLLYFSLGPMQRDVTPMGTLNTLVTKKNEAIF